jgi:hypothetical protein
MGKLQKQFESKYGFDAVNFIKQLGNRFLGMIKTIGLDSAMVSYADEIGLKIPMNETYSYKPSDSFLIDLIQAIAEAGQKFPENQKVRIDDLGGEAEVSSIDVSVPKSKGVLEDFKDIVADDELRPVMNGVFVSSNGFLIGTDAHKLVKFKNSTYSKDADKIIDLNAYIKSKGDVLRFIDGKYPNYEGVIPRDNPNKVKNIPTYAFYNFCKSAVALKKLQDSDIFNVNFNDKGENFSFNPILFAELLGFALAKGFNTFDLEFSNSTRAFLLNFEGGSEGLIMPIYNKQGLQGTKPYTFDEVIEEFGDGGKSKSSKPKALPKQGEPKLPKQEQPYKKYEGSLDDVTYIPRRDISMVILKNGDELTNADIVDGVYRLKKKFAKGGMAGKSNFRGIDLFEDYDLQEPKLRSITKKIDTAYDEDRINTKFLQERLDEVEAIGYTFEFDMDGGAYGLRPKSVDISELEGYEEFAKGGNVKKGLKVSKKYTKIAYRKGK